MRTDSKVQEISISAVVRRADGTTERLGRIAYYHKNPVVRWWQMIRHRGLGTISLRG